MYVHVYNVLHCTPLGYSCTCTCTYLSLTKSMINYFTKELLLCWASVSCQHEMDDSITVNIKTPENVHVLYPGSITTGGIQCIQ